MRRAVAYACRCGASFPMYIQVRSIIIQMDVILSDFPEEHAAAVQALQEALMVMIGEAEDEDEDEEGKARCEPCGAEEME